MELIEVNFNDEGDIIDTLSGKILKDTPEERVRQRFINLSISCNRIMATPKTSLQERFLSNRDRKFLVLMMVPKFELTL